MQTLVYVLYDGILNSVFAGQVLAPLLDLLAHNGQLSVLLVSFERTIIPHATLKKITPDHARIQIIQRKRLPFIGRIGLLPDIRALKKILATVPGTYTMRVRGPLAGWIALRAYNPKKCTALLVQARGLAAAEYTFTHGNHSWWHRWRARLLKKIEQKTYSTAPAIEAVSAALKEYLVTQFNAQPETITIAHADIPPVVPHEQRTAWRTAIRTQLAIPADAPVYCYSGSAKAWQCPEKTVAYFAHTYHSALASKQVCPYLLVLTQDKEVFARLLAHHAIAPEHYTILSVAHTNMYQYLSACDIGLMLRQQDIVNWVSRPTKALEYYSAGLTIVHNNTIAWLNEFDQRDNQG